MGASLDALGSDTRNDSDINKASILIILIKVHKPLICTNNILYVRLLMKRNVNLFKISITE